MKRMGKYTVLGVLLLSLVFLNKCVGGGGGTSQIQIESLSTTNALPASLLTITGSGFDPNAELSVRFSDGKDFTLDIPVIDVNTTAVTSSVPPFINLMTGEFGPGTVDVQVIRKSGTDILTSNTISGFQIQDLPFPAATAGTTTLDFLNATIDLASQLQIDIIGTTLDTPDLNAAIATQITNLEALVTEIEAVVQDPSQSFTLGSIAGTSITIGTSELLATDRMIIGILLSQAGSGLASSSIFDRLSLVRKAWAQSTQGCQAQEASATLTEVLGSDQPDVAQWTGYFGAPTTSLNCKTAEAFNTAYLVVGGVGAVGIGILALAGVPAYALALPAAALLYVTVAGGGGMIAVGGALGQDTPGATELVQGGVKKIEAAAQSILKTVVLPLVPEPVSTLDNLKSLLEGASNVKEAFFPEDEPPPPTEEPPPVGGGAAVAIDTASCTVGGSFIDVAATGTASGPIGAVFDITRSPLSGGEVISCNSWGFTGEVGGGPCTRSTGNPETTSWEFENVGDPCFSCTPPASMTFDARVEDGSGTILATDSRTVACQ